MWKLITKQKYEEHIIKYFRSIDVDFEVINEVILIKCSRKDRDFLTVLRTELEEMSYPCKFHTAFL